LAIDWERKSKFSQLGKIVRNNTAAGSTGIDFLYAPEQLWEYCQKAATNLKSSG
jgi:hypothetical protein